MRPQAAPIPSVPDLSVPLKGGNGGNGWTGAELPPVQSIHSAPSGTDGNGWERMDAADPVRRTLAHHHAVHRSGATEDTAT
jgi:hypothetical protein